MPITTPVRTEYTAVFQPPIPQPRELKIKLHADHKKHQMVCYCKQKENLGGYASPAVTFQADFDGKLHFGDPSFFGTSDVLLGKEEKVLLAKVKQGETTCFVTADVSASEEMYTNEAMTPIIIRVP